MTTPYYQDEHVTLYHGDCLEMGDLWAGCDVLLSDPPYGRGWNQNFMPGKTNSVLTRVGIANDKTTDTRDAMLAMWGQDKPAITFGDLMVAPPEGTKLVAVYKKPDDVGWRGSIGNVRRDCEAIYFNSGFKHAQLGGRSSLFTSSEPMVSGSHGLVAKSGGHPHSKPLDVLCELLRLMPEGVVADPFAGGGSTLVAAKLMGRRAVGVELDERWCEVAARRLSQDVFDFGEWTA